MNPGTSYRLIKFLEFIDSSKEINGNSLEDKLKNLCFISGEQNESQLAISDRELESNHGLKVTQSSSPFTSSDQFIPGLDLMVKSETSNSNNTEATDNTMATNNRIQFKQTKSEYINMKFKYHNKYNRSNNYKFSIQQELHQKRVIEADNYREQLVMQAYGLTQEEFDAM